MILVGYLDKIEKVLICLGQKKNACVYVHSLRAAGYFYGGEGRMRATVLK